MDVIYSSAASDVYKRQRYCFGTIANTVCDALDVKACLAGCSVWNEIKA
mgnify:CR=1 FL=1